MYRKFFPDAAAPPNEPLEGSSFFQGPYSCSHCGGAFAQWGRFVLVSVDGTPRTNGTTSFCTPECVAAYDRTAENWQERHAALEQYYGRHIEAAPTKHQMQGMDRSEWLPRVRFNASVEDGMRMQQEMIVVCRGRTPKREWRK